MGEKDELTLVDVLKLCVNMLEDISIPAKYAVQIAKPIVNVIGNLGLCIEAEEARLAEAAKSEAEKAKAEKEGDGGGEAGTDHATLE